MAALDKWIRSYNEGRIKKSLAWSSRLGSSKKMSGSPCMPNSGVIILDEGCGHRLESLFTRLVMTKR